MESLSRPLHRNQTSSGNLSKKKLSNANSFSSKNNDYGEIFGGSRASSIPILDLSALDGAKASADVRSSKLDYSKIFGGFSDGDVALSYEEMFAKPKGVKSFSDEAGTPAKKASHTDGSDRLNRHKEKAFQYEAPTQTFEGMKEFNMSYHRTSQRSNDRTNGATHVAQLYAVPGFTCFIDEKCTLQKTEGDKSKVDAQSPPSPPKAHGNLTKKQTSDGTGGFGSQSSGDKFCSTYKSSIANERKTHPSKMSSPSSLPANLVSNKSASTRSMDSNFKVPVSDASRADPSYCSPSLSDEELDVNSAAAASAAALRKALEKAQASIRFAKEFMERKKDGPQRFSKPSYKDGLDIKKRKEDKVTVEATRIREKDAKEISEGTDIVLEVFTKSEREKARRSSKVAPDFKERDEISIVKEAVRETNGNIMESAEACEPPKQISGLEDRGERRTATSACEHADGRNNSMPSVDTHEYGKKEMETSEEIMEQLDQSGKKADEEAQKLEDLEGKVNTVKLERDFEQHVYRLDTAQEVHEQEQNEKARVDEATEEKQKTSTVKETCENELEESVEPNENEEFESQGMKANNNEGLGEAHDSMENEKKLVEISVKEQNEKSLNDDHEKESESSLQDEIEMCEQDEIEKRLPASCLRVDDEEAGEVESTEKRQHDANEGKDNENSLDKIHELDITNERLNGTSDGEESEGIQEDDSDWEGKENILVEACEYEETENMHRETTEIYQEAVEERMSPDGTSNASEWDEGESMSESGEVHRHTQDYNDSYYEESERTPEVTQSSDEFEKAEDWLEAVEVALEVEEKEECKAGGLVGGAAEQIETENQTKSATERLLSSDNPANNCFTGMSFGTKHTDRNEKESELTSNMGSGVKMSVCVSVEGEKKVDEKTSFNLEEVKSNFNTAYKRKQWFENMGAFQPASMFKGEEKTMTDEHIKPSQIEEQIEENLDETFVVEEKETKEAEQKELEEEKEHIRINDEANKREREREKDRAYRRKQWFEIGQKMEAFQPASMFEGEEKTMTDEHMKPSQIEEKTEENLNQTFAVEEKETKETEQKEVKAEKERLRINDEAKKREREREKDRMAVERAIREARERAFAEARERAERAAVEKATAEARKRVMAETKEKFEKASAATRLSAEKASMEAKLKAERAAVERATSEARERALEALSQKATSGTREQAERYVADKFSGVSRDNGMRQSFSSSDIRKLDETSGESAQRSKARLERNQRTMERASKALAEKNRRDLLAQKEQAERNRFAETLDAEVKRWSSGKEGNLRALLSTLQYILGPNSGWQPVSLTDIITTSAVKKAYRKATLRVHPDKLQQRGATIQQKYICEKVFDLLKAAWNKFNSEER